MAGFLCALFSFIILFEKSVAFILVAGEESPCASYHPRETEKRYRSQADAILFLREECGREANLKEMEDFVERTNSQLGLFLDLLPHSVTCQSDTRVFEALMHIFGEPEGKARALIATLDDQSCDILAKFARLWKIPLITWTCPLRDSRERDTASSVVRLSPSLPSLARALAQLFLYLHWKSVVVIAIDREPWSSLERAVSSAFHSSGIAVRNQILLGHQAQPEEIRERLAPVRTVPRKATVLCLPPSREGFADSADSADTVDSTDSSDPTDWTDPTTTVLMELDAVLRADVAHFAIILLHTQEDGLFIPSSTTTDRVDSASSATGYDPTNSPITSLSLVETTDDTTTLMDSQSFASSNRSGSSYNYYSISTTPNISAWQDTVEFNSTDSSERPTPSALSEDGRFFTARAADSVDEQVTVMWKSGDEDPLDSWSGMSTLEQPFDPVIGKFIPSTNLSRTTIEKFFVFVPLDQRYDVEKVFNGTEYYETPTLLDHVNESLLILKGFKYTVDTYNNKMYNYAMVNWRQSKWKPVLVVSERQEGDVAIESLNSRTFVIDDSVALDEADCEYGKDEQDAADARGPVKVKCKADTKEASSFSARFAHVVSMILLSLLVTLFGILVAVFIRQMLNWLSSSPGKESPFHLYSVLFVPDRSLDRRRRCLLRRRIEKGPYKIILTTSDFVFPQMGQIDSRRVDQGIETMLCCWLQQLQEFGGPEVEKPDLLQLGSVGSLKPYLRNSTGNLAKYNFLKDPRARYNGDLVQLKELPCQGSFELKAKAMAALVTIHGLRHENLNPLIGCLNEPSRPCLVYDYCSRGSLEDVLVQDEIKLDWSFRLSLLTDLVRGMRYLHGTPIRVHGYLTSRNCVIDARWVLKVTDYGLPSFYDAQGISPPAKTARDLLWTAPELLRHTALRKKGTQAADVYSFGIIMQEVVVRGEPFCMLALSPDEIIEKVMRPPPLIRPSVSKGAAPPEAINIMRQCWAEVADMRPDFNDVHDLFKKLNNGRKVNFMDTMFQMLEKYSNNLEELIRERTEQLDMEKKKTEQLLNRMLPSSVAEKLKLGMPVDPEEFREVTIYFSDIVGFTTISAHSTPFQVVDLLNDLYTCFDATINAYTVYKVETIGDAYMVVAGCPVRIPDHATQIATMALDLLHQSGKFRLKHLPKTQLRLRIGLHTGPCCAGVVGLTMPRYCLFGDTVNTASRMESTGAPWRIHMSQATRDCLDQVGGYHIEYRGKTDIKGKGKMPTYWLLGKQGFDKELPTPPPLGFDESLTTDPDGDAEPVESVHSEDRSALVEVGEQSQEEGRASEGDEEPVFKATIVEIESPREAPPVPEEDTLSGNLSRDAETAKPKAGTEEGAAAAAAAAAAAGAHSLSETGSVAVASIFGASTSSLSSVSSSVAATAALSSHSGAYGRPAGVPATTTASASRNRRPAGIIEESDLSTPYNHYRCLSPNEPYAKTPGCRLLKRQFSLDRPDEPALFPHAEHYHHQHHLHRYHHHRHQLQPLAPQQPPFEQQQQQQQQQQHQRVPLARLYKQNSAGAANDLERIQEIPPAPGSALQNLRGHAASVSLSVESLSFL